MALRGTDTWCNGGQTPPSDARAGAQGLDAQCAMRARTGPPDGAKGMDVNGIQTVRES